MSSPLSHSALTESLAFEAYRKQLIAWIHGETDDGERALRHAGHVLHDEARSLGMQPEHAVISLHATGPTERWIAESDDGAWRSFAQERYATALGLLAGLSPEELSAPRLVHAPNRPDSWLIMLVRESRRLDTRTGRYRKDWLSCVTTNDRRYIMPVPQGWELLCDTTMLSAIGKAKPDLRGPL